MLLILCGHEVSEQAQWIPGLPGQPGRPCGTERWLRRPKNQRRPTRQRHAVKLVHLSSYGSTHRWEPMWVVSRVLLNHWLTIGYHNEPQKMDG